MSFREARLALPPGRNLEKKRVFQSMKSALTGKKRGKSHLLLPCSLSSTVLASTWWETHQLRGISSGAAERRLRAEAALIMQLWTIGQAQYCYWDPRISNRSSAVSTSCDRFTTGQLSRMNHKTLAWSLSVGATWFLLHVSTATLEWQTNPTS